METLDSGSWGTAVGGRKETHIKDSLKRLHMSWVLKNSWEPSRGQVFPALGIV